MHSIPTYLVVGAGFSGAVLARELAESLPVRIVVVDQRDHVAGNSHTVRDPRSGVMIHAFGPHIFNTDSERVWKYVNAFGTFRPFVNRVKARTARGIFSFPINLHTINQFFGTTFDPSAAREFVAGLGDPTITVPANFEEQALKSVGRELYEAFLRGYTQKMWGCDPRELPASILRRLPIRFNYDDNYYEKRWQGIPEDGYTAIVARILDHPRIELRLGQRAGRDASGYDHVFFTGPLDAYFDHALGRLGYRTVAFERIDAGGDFQGTALINYTQPDVPWTRIHEHKHFAPWETHESTVAFREYSRETRPGDEPYYPKRLHRDVVLLRGYREAAESTRGVSFLGRLGTYRYMDMETVIGEAIAFAADVVARRRDARPPRVFPDSPA